MKIIVIFLFPLILSFLLYVFSLIVGFEYNRAIEEALHIFHFSGANYITNDFSVFISYGALVWMLVVIFPFSIYLYRVLDIQKVKKARHSLSINKIFIASAFLFFVYISIFFVPVNSYSAKGVAIVEFILGQPFLFYLFYVFPCQVLTGLWVMCVKLKFY